MLAKIAEEIGEIRHEIASAAAPERLADELGDVLFAVAHLARHLHLDPEAALRGTTPSSNGVSDKSNAGSGGSRPDPGGIDAGGDGWLTGKDQIRGKTRLAAGLRRSAAASAEAPLKSGRRKSMTENSDNLVLEILRRLQSGTTDLKAGQRDIQYRLTLVETRLAGVERNLTDHYAAYAG